jgi:hypothetical protein
MSIKDLFGKSSEKIVSAKQLKDFYSESESEGYLEEVIKDKDRFLPAVDFSTASNFARYGSAEKYYVDGISNIYQNYPYDGSRKEKQEWRNASSQLDLYIFDNIYPKTVGYVNLDSGSLLSTIRNSVSYRSASVPQYVLVRGGPNPSPNGKFEKANIYDLSKNRESNLGISELGNTVEFWFKDNASTGSVNYNNVFCLFDSWNGVSSGSDSYARLTIQHSASNSFLLTYASGTSGIVEHPLSFAVDRNSWNHYAFTFKNAENNIDLELCLYVNGDLAVKETVLNAGGISLANNYGMYASIGAFMADQDAISSNSWRGLGTSFGSFDEFRFWKSVRSSKQIYRNCFVQVGGGSNTDDSNTDLGVYYKFNEGIINSSSNNDLDAVCVDYSGRASNALIINYNINVRNTSSAIDIHLNGDLPITDPDYVYYEEKDPILFSSNPLVIQISDYYQKVGSEHDRNNNANIYYSIPSWIVEDAENRESNDLSNLVQIISSYFDSLHLQIKDLPTLKNADYVKDGIKPKPFTNKLLSSYGFENVEIFNDVTFLEDVLSRGEQINFEEKLHNIKNTIYQNIYNNLAYIYKSKGTEKSLRNLIRCFGVDDELIKINLYADESRYEFTDKFKSTTTVKKFVDFNDADRYNGFIYQKNINGDTDTKGYISGNLDGNLDYVPITSQVEVIFPKKVLYDDPQYEIPDWTEVSLFGAHTAKQDENNLIWGNELNNDLFNFQVYAVKRNYESPDVYFKLVTTMSGTTTVLTTSYYNEVYDNQKWNFAVRLSPTKLDFANTVTQSNISDYVLEFIGHNSILDNVENSFKLSLQIPEANGKAALRSNKRFYVGAHYTNFNSSYLLAKTDIKASSLRVWMDYLSDDELKLHSYDSSNFGRQYPNWKPHYETTEDSSLTKLDTLALNWDFFNVTSSDNSGQFLVQDTSTGSLSKSLNYSSVGKVALLRHTGFADNFYPNDDQVVNKEYIFSAKQVNPESIAGSDLIQTPLTDDVTRTKTSKPINFYISIEKSMYQIINDEILNWFSTIKDFNNLVGDPIEKYRAEYKSLNHLKRMFFDKVGTAPDFEKFLSFYKWIDNSISSMLTQFIPASANTTNKVRNIIESHLLERNKYQNIPPNLNFNGDIKSIFGSTLNYSYEDQKAPASPPGQLWLKQRVERTDVYANTPLEPQNDIDREIIRQVINSKNLTSVPVFYNAANNEQYDGKKDAVRFFGQTYRLDVKTLTIAEKIINPVQIANQQFTGQFKFAQQSVTGSGQIVQPLKKKPNFLNKYEYLQLSGRATNNKSFIDVTGAISSVTSSVSGVVDRTLPNRNTYKNIFVERFSAPGGPETLSRGALDNTSEEYSAYNDLNSRNIRVRKQLRSWLAESASYDRVNPSIHKVNKNTGYRPLDNSGVTIKPVYDNAYVSHLIPQSDAQYSWITGALAAKPKTSGYMTDYENLNSYNSSSFQLLSGSVSGTSIIDYLGLNLTIDRSVDLINGITNTGSNYDGDLNKYLNNNNGPFGYPSWKQIRKDTNKIVQDSVKNNKILSQDIPIQRSKTEKGYTLFYTNNKEQTFTAYKQPAVTFNKPMKHSLFVTGSEEALHIVSTYDNNKERFSNSDLAKATKTYEKNDPQAHDLFAALDDGLYDPKPELYKIDYETLLYPSDTYAGLSDVRLRDNYEDFIGNTGSIVNARTFWRNSADERARASVTKDIYDFGNTSYDALLNKKYFTLYNDEINNVILLDGKENIKESILAQDFINDFSSSNQYDLYFNTSIINKIILINSLGETNRIKDSQLINNAIYSVYSGSNGVYVGGDFNASSIGIGERVTLWDGVKWSPMGNGLDGTVIALVSGSNRVYAGGYFTPAAGSGSYVSQWNGTNWSPMAGGLNSVVHALVSGSNRVYVGGGFDSLASGSYVSQWNGASWSPMGGGLNSTVYAIASGSNRVYAGGDFDSPSSGSRVSQWNGTSWSPMGGGLDFTVYTLVSGSNRVYAGGNFASVASGTYISQWDGTSWSPVGGGLSSTVKCLFSHSSGLYAGSNVDSIFSGSRIAKWDGYSWSIPNLNNFIGNINSLFYGADGLYVVGNTNQLGGKNYSYGITKYDNSWKNISFNSYINVVISGSSRVYAGGIFTNIYGTNISQWDGTNWSPMGGGLDYLVKTLVSGSNRVYAGGLFGSFISGSFVSQWNGTNWSPMGGGLNNIANILISGSNRVYAGGDFDSPSSGSRVSQWNGTNWSPMAGGLNGTVNALVSGSNRVYAGGNFTPAAGSGSYVSQWNGTAWSPMGGGFNSTVYALASGSNRVYAGGDFVSLASGTCVSQWDGTSWSPMGGGLNGSVRSLFSHSSGLYAGGQFTKAEGNDVFRLAKWDGNKWSSVYGSSMDSTVNSIFYGNNELYVGGVFTTVQQQNLNRISYNFLNKGDISNNTLLENSYYTKNNILYPLDGVATYNIKQKNIYNIDNNLKDIDSLNYNQSILSVISGNDGLYLGGNFSVIGSNNVIGVIKRANNSWYTLGQSINNTVRTLASGSNRIYAGGDFTSPHLAVSQWDGTSWSAMGGGLSSIVFTLISGSSRIYAGGNFTPAAGSGSYVSQWNGTNWSPMAGGLPNTVYTLVSGSNRVYAGGRFDSAASGSKVSQWNGTSWSPMAGGLHASVYVLISGSNRVYAGGNFNLYGSGTYVSQWDGTNWSPVGGGLNGNVYSMYSNSSGLYVGGEFTSGSNDGTSISLNNIALWDGIKWQQIGSTGIRNGFNIKNTDIVYSIIGDEQKVIFAGNFIGTRSGPQIKDQRYQPVEVYDISGNLLIPTPQIVHNNFIPPSVGSLKGMIISEPKYNSFNTLITPVTEYTSSERISILNQSYQYEIDKKSGKTPFFNSYLEYLGDLKAQTQKYSIVPEYTISDFVKTYITDKNGNYNAILNDDYLKLDGASQESSYENINDSINTSNLLKPEIIFDNSKNNENINLNLKISGIKKLIPYRDFYPSERVVKLSNYFINSFLDLDTRLTSVLNPEEIYSSSLSNGTPINQQILTLLQPVMAPGILLNTIKSSVAVDWPLFITNSVTYDSQIKPDFYAETGSNLITNQAYNIITNQYYNYTASNYIDKEQNYRLPFEAIIEFDTRIPQELRSDDKNLYYLNPTYYTSDAITGSDYTLLAYPSYNMGTGSLKPFVFRDANYKLAMHNFLAEIPNFFLNGKLTNIVSLPENEFSTAKRGVTYYMDVVLERDSKYKEFIADPYYEGLKAQANSFYDGTFLLPSPDSLYGPPTRYWNNVNPNPFFARSPYNFFSKLLDTPAYAPYVPPYYYGKAVARISFTADDSRQYSLSEIQASCSVEYINTEAEELFRQRSNFINGNFTGSFTDNYSTSPAYKQMMRLSSSVNLFLASDTKLTKFDPKTGQTIEVGDRETNNKSWIIQTKFETPSINFIDSDLSGNLGLQFLGGTKESGSVKGIYSYMMKGLWTTYGQPVDNGSGIKLYVQDSFQKIDTNKTGSLIELCGFRNAGDKKTIGLLAERKKVSECMVMIPYTFNKNHGPSMNRDYAATIDPILGENGIYLSSQTGNGPYYYAIDMGVMVDYLGGLSFERASVEQIKAAAEASPYRNSTIIKLILAMIKYVVPPHLDWIRNKDIRPFVMYVAEFSTEFDKQDLSDIWQGVMPKQSYKAEIEQIDINHKFTVNEFFHGKRPQNDTKFKVFKVKQRANINYYKLTDDSKDDDRFKFTFGNSQQATIPEYSYNWPYDFFSLVELVNIDANLSVDNFPQTTEAQRRKTLSEAVQTLGPVRPEIAKEILGDKIKQDRKGDRLEVENTRLKPGSDSSREQPETPLAPKFKKIKKPRGD